MSLDARRLVLAAALIVAPAPLLAQSPTPPGTITACYVPASGTIYRINTTKVVGGGVNITGALTGNEFLKVLVRESYPASDRSWRFGISNEITKTVAATIYAVCL